MEKKIKRLAALFAACALSLVLFGCEQSSDGSDIGDGTESGGNTLVGNNSAGTGADSGSIVVPTPSTAPEGFVLIQPGKFTMGEYPGTGSNMPHRVTLTRSFYMSKYEVTQKEYQEIMGSNPSNFTYSYYGEVKENRPVENVSWYAALVYCNKRSIAENLAPCYTIDKQTDPSKWGSVPTPSESSSTWDAVVCDFNANGYRLPTEAEWEYAARARAGDTTENTTWSGTAYAALLVDYAWYSANSDGWTHEVGKKKPNAFGLYDMSGNVWEWCWDWYSSDYYSDTNGATDPTGPSSGSDRVNRGGCWYYGARNCSVASRRALRPGVWYVGTTSGLVRDNLGFRLVRSAN